MDLLMTRTFDFPVFDSLIWIWSPGFAYLSCAVLSLRRSPVLMPLLMPRVKRKRSRGLFASNFLIELMSSRFVMG